MTGARGTARPGGGGVAAVTCEETCRFLHCIFAAEHCEFADTA